MTVEWRDRWPATNNLAPAAIEKVCLEANGAASQAMIAVDVEDQKGDGLPAEERPV